MEKLSYICSIYVLVLGIALVLFSIIECVIPRIIMTVWEKWINSPLFFLHGFLLAVGGLPLTFFRDSISGKIMMAVGIFVILTGAFIIIYPDRIRKYFLLTESEVEDEDRKGLAYIDAVVHAFSGILFIWVISHYRDFPF